jgi:hypothetical protein
MALPAAHDPTAPPPDLLPAVQVRLEALTRKLDLIERRVAQREAVLAEVKAAAAPVAGAGETVAADLERLSDLDDRIARLERRGFGPTPGGHALDFARFDPSEARPGESVQLSVRVEGFTPGDTVEFVLTDLLTEAELPPLSVTISETHPAGVALSWKIPERPTGQAGAYRFIARGRGCESRSPVLTVRGT